MLTCGCPAKRATTSAPAAFGHVDFTGCAAIVAGPTCEVSRDRALVIAPPSDATDVAIAFAVGASDLVPATSDGSRARRVTIPMGAREIVVRGKEAGRVVEWRLALREATPEPAVVTEARELRAKGALDDAARTLTEQIAVLEGASRALALSALARVEIARGASDAAREHLGAAMDAHAAVGRFSTAADDATVLVFLLLEQRRFADARKTLARASEWSKDYYDGRVQVRFYEGYLARDTGDVRTALAKLDGAIADADAMSLARISGIMRMERALTHAEIGRVDEALGALRDLESIEGRPRAIAGSRR